MLQYIYCISKTYLTPPLFIEVSVSSQESERSCIFVLEVSNLSLSTIFHWILELFRQCCIFWFWNCSDSVVFFVFLDFGAVPAVLYFLFFY